MTVSVWALEGRSLPRPLFLSLSATAQGAQSRVTLGAICIMRGLSPAHSTGMRPAPHAPPRCLHLYLCFCCAPLAGPLAPSVFLSPSSSGVLTGSLPLLCFCLCLVLSACDPLSSLLLSTLSLSFLLPPYDLSCPAPSLFFPLNRNR